jgi:hypothetical protein
MLRVIVWLQASERLRLDLVFPNALAAPVALVKPNHPAGLYV